MIKAILFDAEGVILDTEKLWDDATREFLSRRAIEYNRIKIKHLVAGKSLQDSSEIMKKEYSLNENTDFIANERKEIIKDLFWKNISYIHGFNKFINEIKEKCEICVVTSMDIDLFNIADEKLNLKELFKRNVFSVKDVGNVSKPNPRIFLFALDQLRVKPSECIVIEDSPLGIKAANRANIFSIGITTTFPAKRLIEADLIIKSFDELDLNKINRYLLRKNVKK